MRQMVNILVTGCNGFIGRHLCAALAYNPDIKCHITGIDPSEVEIITPSPILDVFQKCDTGSFMKNLNDGHQLKNLFPEKVKYDIIIHLGGISRSKIYDEYPEDSVSSDTLALLSVLSYCRFHPKTKLIFLSTFNAGASMKTYHVSKLNAECLISSYVRRYGISAAVIKLDKVFGPGEIDYAQYNSLLRACKNAVINGTIPTQYGDGNQEYDWVHVTRVCEGIVSIIKDHMFIQDRRGQLNFQIFSGVRRSVSQIMKAFGFEHPHIDMSTQSPPFKQLNHNKDMLPYALKRQYDLGIPQIDVLEYIEAWMQDNAPS